VKLHRTPLEGVIVVEAAPVGDNRGFFLRMHSAKDFEAAGLPPLFEQTGMSHNNAKGTLRGIHFQTPPFGESKLVRCMAGAVFDVVVDLRDGSATFGQSFSIRLEAAKPEFALFIPAGFAHGFQSLADNSRLLYQINGTYSPLHEAGIRWDDTALAIAWPLAPTVISQRDRELPRLSDLPATGGGRG